ncbi:MAG: hypothetical protein WBA17_01020 [Saprospiraceae bacterium]
MSGCDLLPLVFYPLFFNFSKRLAMLDIMLKTQLLEYLKNNFNLTHVIETDTAVSIQSEIGYGIVMTEQEDKLIITPITTYLKNIKLEIKGVSSISTKSKNITYISRQIKEKIFDKKYIQNYYAALVKWRYK